MGCRVKQRVKLLASGHPTHTQLVQVICLDVFSLLYPIFLVHHHSRTDGSISTEIQSKKDVKTQYNQPTKI